MGDTEIIWKDRKPFNIDQQKYVIEDTCFCLNEFEYVLGQ